MESVPESLSSSRTWCYIWFCFSAILSLDESSYHFWAPWRVRGIALIESVSEGSVAMGLADIFLFLCPLPLLSIISHLLSSYSTNSGPLLTPLQFGSGTICLWIKTICCHGVCQGLCPHCQLRPHLCSWISQFKPSPCLWWVSKIFGSVLRIKMSISLWCTSPARGLKVKKLGYIWLITLRVDNPYVCLLVSLGHLTSQFS